MLLSREMLSTGTTLVAFKLDFRLAFRFVMPLPCEKEGRTRRRYTEQKDNEP